ICCTNQYVRCGCALWSANCYGVRMSRALLDYYWWTIARVRSALQRKLWHERDCRYVRYSALLERERTSPRQHGIEVHDPYRPSRASLCDDLVPRDGPAQPKPGGDRCRLRNPGCFSDTYGPRRSPR